MDRLKRSVANQIRLQEVESLPPEEFADGRAGYSPEIQRQIGLAKKNEMIDLLNKALEEG